MRSGAMRFGFLIVFGVPNTTRGWERKNGSAYYSGRGPKILEREETVSLFDRRKNGGGVTSTLGSIEVFVPLHIPRISEKDTKYLFDYGRLLIHGCRNCG